MATVLTVLNDVLSIIGNPNPTATQQTEALRFLQDMVSSISAENLTIHSNDEDTHTLTASTSSYTYGTGGDINSARPVTIVSAYIEDANGDDFPVELISEARYNKITDKTVEGRPYQVFYNATYPTATVNTYYVPDLSTYVLHLIVRKKIATLTALTDSISLPDEYLEYIKRDMVLRMASLYGYVPTREDILLAQKSEANVKSVNRRATERTVPSELLFM